MGIEDDEYCSRWTKIGQQTFREVDLLWPFLLPDRDLTALRFAFVQYVQTRYTRYERSADERLLLVHEFFLTEMRCR